MNLNLFTLDLSRYYSITIIFLNKKGPEGIFREIPSEAFLYLRDGRPGAGLSKSQNVMGYEEIIKGFSIETFQHGDETALQLVFDHFYASILYLNKSLLEGDPISEEIAQDTFLKLWNRRQNFSSLDKIKAFLYLAAKNACLDYIKTQQRRKRRIDLFTQSQLEQWESDADRTIIREEVLRTIAAAIETLPEQCRLVIRMTYLNGKNASEIAEAIGVSASTVRSQQSRGISLLRKKLAGRHFALFLSLLP